jgi:hypothetical protein
METVIMMVKALRWIREKFASVKKAVSTPTDSPNDDSDKEAADSRKKFTNAFESFSHFFADLAKTFHENAQLQRFIAAGESFRKSGYYAGQWGIREPEIGEMAEMQVRITKGLIDEECQSNQRKLNSQVEILSTIREDAERDYRNKNAYYEKLTRAYQYSQRQFSILLGFIYGFFALVLVLADIPLALELTKQGFNLKSDEESAIQDLFLYGTDEGFVFHFIKVLTGNWEVVLFATGIACCTIYIKIFYDDFVGSPLENLIKKAPEAPIADYEEFYSTATDKRSQSKTAIDSEDHTSNRKQRVVAEFARFWRTRFRVKFGVLIGLFLTIGVLGYFRYSVVSAGDEVVARIPGHVTFFTYCLATLIFPTISGICASLSLNTFHNWSHRRRAEKQNAAARNVVIKATDEYRLKEEEKERNSSFISWLESEDTIKQLKYYLIRCYESGYKFGYLYPEWTFGGDLFTRAQALRNRNLTDPMISLNGTGPVKPVPVPQTALN